MIQKSIAFIIVILALIGVFIFFDNKDPRVFQETGSVEKVIDGDTILVNFGTTTETVRLLGIDAPELEYDDQKRVTKRECYAPESQKELQDLVMNKIIILENDPQNDNRDKYDRLLRYVYLPGNILVNEEMISNGSARLLSFFPISKIKEFRKAQEEAKKESLGLWAVCPQ